MPYFKELNARVWIVVISTLTVLSACDAAEGRSEELEGGELAAYLDTTGPVTITARFGGESHEIRLASIDAPDDSLARDWLTAQLEEQQFRFSRRQAGLDRYGRIIADVFMESDAEPQWVQLAMVHDGVVRVLSYRDGPDRVARLLQAESAARSAHRGLWGDRAYRVRDTHPDALMQDVGSVQIVAGRVVSATRLRTGRVYLNFGADWRTDFTVRIDPADAERFERAGLDPLELEGQRIRVRGWVQDENGPMIRIDHPMRIEQLNEDAPIRLE